MLCTGSVYNNGEKRSRLNEESRNGVKVHRVYVPNIDKNNFVKRTLRLSLSSLLLFGKILKLVRNGDDVLVVTNPAFLILMMPLVAWIKGVSYKSRTCIFPENLWPQASVFFLLHLTKV